MDFNRILSSLSGADGKNQFSKHVVSLAVRKSLIPALPWLSSGDVLEGQCFAAFCLLAAQKYKNKNCNSYTRTPSKEKRISGEDSLVVSSAFILIQIE